MAQQLMWNQIEQQYRGQGTNGTVITAEEGAVDLAQKRAGKAVYDTDWWVETLESILDHWGVYSKRWIDLATKMPRMHFTLVKPEPEVKPVTQAPVAAPALPTRPLDSGVLNSGALSTDQLKSGPLKSGPLSTRLLGGKPATRD